VRLRRRKTQRVANGVLCVEREGERCQKEDYRASHDANDIGSRRKDEG
jgi:hypothetical protein